RQKDDKFIQLLNAVRNNSITDFQINQLNKRLNPSFSPPPGDFCINLTTTNQMASEENDKQLAKTGGKLFTFTGKIKGKFEQKDLPTEVELRVKKGAQVMLLNNDSLGRWVNGTVGKIIDISKEEKIDVVTVLTSDEKQVEVTPHTWRMYKTFYNKENKTLDSQSIGSFTQYPIKLAWAVTIHKSQGKTFDNVTIDIGKGTFSHGQVYVALSRCTNLEGIVLKKPILKKNIWMDWKIVKFLTNFQYNLSEKSCSLSDKMEIIQNAIANKSTLDIVYLKGSDEKSKRTVKPLEVGEMEYMNKTYTGMRAYCYKRQDERTFRVDRILELNVKQK
ncbi:MAG: WYL domain-containing protein, partial [Candidatus Micrarchaeota archaeon]